MENRQACVWATRKELWDSFLNDPELARVIDNALSEELQQTESESENSTQSDISGKTADKAQSHHENDENEQNIGARLRAYETPITDEILRQSIR